MNAEITALSPRAELRELLVAMRTALIDGLAAEPHIDPGMLGLLGTVGFALVALDAEDPS